MYIFYDGLQNTHLTETLRNFWLN